MPFVPLRLRALVILVAFSYANAMTWSHVSSEGTREHVDAHVDGFSLHSLFVTARHVDSKHTTVHHRKIKPRAGTSNAARRKLLAALPAFNASVNSRDRVLTLAKLSSFVYPHPIAERAGVGKPGYDDITMQPIFDAGESFFNESVTENEEDFNEYIKVYEMIEQEIADTRHATIRREFSPQATAEFSVGVAALVFTHGDVSVLVFRGTMTPGDNANMANLITYWILEKMSHRLKDAWIRDAGLPWDSIRQARAEEGSVKARAALRAAMRIGSSDTVGIFGGPLKGTFDMLTGAVAEGKKKNEPNLQGVSDYDFNKVQEEGYWPLTKALVDRVYSELGGEGKQFMLSGHSQGGLRAQFASMYLRKKKRLRVPTVTFAAVGATCSSRLTYFEDGSILSDVDPFISHDQITDYVHPLDVYGNGLDLPLGTKCLYGVSDMEQSLEYKWCKEVFGYSGPSIMVTAFGIPTEFHGEEKRRQEQLGADFKRCRYFTHMARTIAVRLAQPGVLFEDGTTDGGCLPMAVVELSDEKKACPKMPTGVFDGLLNAAASAGAADEVNDATLSPTTEAEQSGRAAAKLRADAARAEAARAEAATSRSPSLSPSSNSAAPTPFLNPEPAAESSDMPDSPVANVGSFAGASVVAMAGLAALMLIPGG